MKTSINISVKTIFAVIISMALLNLCCSRDLEGEIYRYRKNIESVERFIREYPQFGRFLRYELEKAKSLWYGSEKIGDRAKQKEMISRSNELIYCSTLLSYLHSYDGRRGRIIRNMQIIEPYGNSERFRVRIRQVMKKARTALNQTDLLMARSVPPSEQGAIDLVRRADEMLVKPEAQVLRLKKAIRDEKLREKAAP